MEPIGKHAWVKGSMLAPAPAGGLFYAPRESIAGQRDRTPGDRCAMHDVAFETDVVPIEYGLPAYRRVQSAR